MEKLVQDTSVSLHQTEEMEQMHVAMTNKSISGMAKLRSSRVWKEEGCSEQANVLPLTTGSFSSSCQYSWVYGSSTG